MIFCARCGEVLTNVPSLLEDKAVWVCRPCAHVMGKPDKAGMVDEIEQSMTIEQVVHGHRARRRLSG